MDTKRYWIAAFALAATIAWTGGAAATGASAAPSLQIPEPAYRFEPVIEGTEVTHAFTVRNEGGAPLTIERVATS